MKALSLLVESFFFRTDKLPYWNAVHFGLHSESFQIASPNGNRIVGQLLFSEKNNSNVVLHCHAGIANMHLHLPQIAFLAQAGYPVVTFDYEGCGASDGTLGIDHMGTSAETIALWVRRQPQFNNSRFIVFGQGLGADAALQFYQQNKDLTKALILESAYPDRKNWIRHRFGPVLGDLMVMVLDVQSSEPAEVIQGIQVPTFVAYPENDHWVKPRDKASMLSVLPSTAELFECPKAAFLNIFTDPSGRNQQQILQWLENNKL